MRASAAQRGKITALVGVSHAGGVARGQWRVQNVRINVVMWELYFVVRVVRWRQSVRIVSKETWTKYVWYRAGWGGSCIITTSNIDCRWMDGCDVGAGINNEAASRRIIDGDWELALGGGDLMNGGGV